MKYKAFSYNEILIVAAVAAIMLLIAAPFYLQFINNNNVAYATELTLRFLRSAQLKSINLEENTEWGVCKSSNSISIYKTSCLPSNIVHTFDVSPNVHYTGLTDLKFIGTTGHISALTTITISEGTSTRQIILNTVGGYEIN